MALLFIIIYFIIIIVLLFFHKVLKFSICLNFGLKRHNLLIIGTIVRRLWLINKQMTIFWTMFRINLWCTNCHVGYRSISFDIVIDILLNRLLVKLRSLLMFSLICSLNIDMVFLNHGSIEFVNNYIRWAVWVSLRIKTLINGHRILLISTSLFVVKGVKTGCSSAFLSIIWNI